MTASSNVWAELGRLCLALHALLYDERNTEAARAHLLELESLLEKLPTNDASIVGAEGHAIFHELSGSFSLAIVSRLREVELMEKLHDDIQKNSYDAVTQSALLAGRDQADLSIRKAIIRSLRRKLGK